MTNSSHRLPGLVAILLASFSLVVCHCSPCKAQEEAPAQALLIIGLSPKTSPTEEPTFDPAEFELYKATQAALLQDPHLLQPALDSNDIRRLPPFRGVDNKIAWLTEHVSVTFPGDAQLMCVEFDGGNADERRRILHAIVNSYLDNVVMAEERDSYVELQYLQLQYEKKTEECVELREAIGDLQSQRVGDAASNDDGEEAAAGNATSTSPNAELAQLQFELQLHEEAMREIFQTVERRRMQVELRRRVQLLREARVIE